MYRIVNSANNNVLAEHAELADSFIKRMLGLLPRKSLALSGALIIKPTGSIHTFFMRFSIDIVFLDRNNKVIKLRHNVPPFRFVVCPFGAKTTIELPAGTLHRVQIKTEDPVVLKIVSNDK